MAFQSLHRPFIVVAGIFATLLFPSFSMAQTHEKDWFIVGNNNIFHPSVEPVKELFALKTNLLLDAVTAVNAELEVPLGKRWSVSGEILFPWWLLEKQGHCLEILAGTGEVKCWLGNRESTRKGLKRQKLTGWFLGLHAGGGIYDVGYDGKGYQGSFYYGGLTGGYAHPIGCRLRMEYSLGVGAFKTLYDRYTDEAECGTDKPVWQHKGNYTMLGPTRAKVSLVWMITKTQKKPTK